MNLIFTLSLEQRALTTIAIALWSQEDVRDLMSKSALHTLHNSWQEIENVVAEKSFKLRLPEALKQKLLEFIVGVGWQIISWVNYHHSYCRLVTELPAMFAWTSLGTIDNGNTAKLLVRSGTLNGDASYTLACMYCLEDEIKHCWNVYDLSMFAIDNENTAKLLVSRGTLNDDASYTLPCTCYLEDEIKYCRNVYDLSMLTSKFNRPLLTMSYWFDRMKELTIEKHNPSLINYRCLITEAIRRGNLSATKYFYQKLSMEEKNHVMTFAKDLTTKIATSQKFSLKRYSEVMIFLLSKLNVEQQTYMFVKYTYAMLTYLLVWPWQSLFLEMVNSKWEFLSRRNYSKLLHNMVNLMGYYRNLHKLLREFWHQSPEPYKKFATIARNIVKLILRLYQRGDETSIKLILKDTSISDRESIIFYPECQAIFTYLISSEEWNSVEFLIQECIASRAKLKIFRDTLYKHMPHIRKFYSKHGSIKDYQLNKFFQLLDECISKWNKRSAEDNYTSSKKIICL